MTLYLMTQLTAQVTFGDVHVCSVASPGTDMLTTAMGKNLGMYLRGQRSFTIN